MPNNNETNKELCKLRVQWEWAVRVNDQVECQIKEIHDENKMSYFGGDNFLLVFFSSFFNSFNFHSALYIYLNHTLIWHVSLVIIVKNDYQWAQQCICWQATIRLSVIQYRWTMRHGSRNWLLFGCLLLFSLSLVLLEQFGVMWTECTERRRTKFCIDLARQIHIMLKNTGQQFVMCSLTLTCPDFSFAFCVFGNISNYNTLQFCLKSKSLSTRQKQKQKQNKSTP